MTQGVSTAPQNASSGKSDRKPLSGIVPLAGLLLNLMAGRMETNPSTERVDER